jgi:transposase-like protein
LNKVALAVQANMKKDLREIYLAPNRAAADMAIGVFAEKYAAKHEKAVECLTKDRDALLALYDFPAEHWDHLRTTNPIKACSRRSGTGRCARKARCRQFDGVQTALRRYPPDLHTP